MAVGSLSVLCIWLWPVFLFENASAMVQKYPTLFRSRHLLPERLSPPLRGHGGSPMQRSRRYALRTPFRAIPLLVLFAVLLLPALALADIQITLKNTFIEKF